jgi:undecaprenyl pyrophosphate phosphatase UppP
MLLGIAASAISGFFAVKYLLRYVQHASYKPFCWYRLGLAVVVILAYLAR